MSFRKAVMNARIAKLPRDLPPVDPAEIEDDEESEANDSIGALGAMSLNNTPRYPSTARQNVQSDVDLTPISASGHFDQAVQVALSKADLDIRVYITPPIPTDNDSGSIMIFHHGAGYSALSFACLAKAVTELTSGECGVMAFDARAHGKTTSLSNPGFDPPVLDLALERMSEDFVELVLTIFPTSSKVPALILVGHSMGGAVITRASAKLMSEGYHVGGIAILDVVEGSALEALPAMHHLLESRPEGFPSQERAVQWHVTGQTGSTIRNIYSARISIPSLVTPATPEEVASGKPAWKWRTPLKSTAPFWQGWFTGLSNSFLAARTARLLILAGTDRLDRELMIGQMQGKFQLVIVPNVGHMLHEDDPNNIAQTLVEFWRRNERLILPNIKKVGQA